MFKEGRHVLDGRILTKHFFHQMDHGSVSYTVLLELLFAIGRIHKFEEDWLIGWVEISIDSVQQALSPKQLHHLQKGYKYLHL